MLKFCVTFCGVGEQLSVALAANENVPAVVGMPVIDPAELMFRPGGSEPEARLKVIAP